MIPDQPAVWRTSRQATPPGETRFWCGTCDPKRQSPYPSARELVAHVMAARRSGAGRHAGMPQ